MKLVLSTISEIRVFGFKLFMLITPDKRKTTEFFLSRRRDSHIVFLKEYGLIALLESIIISARTELDILLEYR